MSNHFSGHSLQGTALLQGNRRLGNQLKAEERIAVIPETHVQDRRNFEKTLCKYYDVAHLPIGRPEELALPPPKAPDHRQL